MRIQIDELYRVATDDDAGNSHCGSTSDITHGHCWLPELPRRGANG